MSEKENTELVRGIYEAFGRGDIPAILNSLANDVDWVVAGLKDGIPYAGTYQGKDDVGQFFSLLAENVEYDLFEARDFVAQDEAVAVFGQYQGRVKPSGKALTTEWAMRWTIQNGRVTNFRVYEDTAAVVAAFTMP
jgi:uncharacterized protein